MWLTQNIMDCFIRDGFFLLCTLPNSSSAFRQAEECHVFVRVTIRVSQNYLGKKSIFHLVKFVVVFKQSEIISSPVFRTICFISCYGKIASNFIISFFQLSSPFQLSSSNSKNKHKVIKSGKLNFSSNFVKR